MKKLALFTIIMLISLANCDDEFLDRTPSTGLSEKQVWNSKRMATKGVNGIYSELAFGPLNSITQYWTNLGPAGYGWVRNNTGLRLGADNATSNYWRFSGYYKGFYTIIKYANDAIANLPDNPNLPEALSKRLLGEARFLRGLSYFYLLHLFGGVIILDKPIKPSETELPRNTEEEVRNFIVNDFKEAIKKLPVSYSSENVGRATKGAAIAMLGKTYLYNKKWGKAAEQFEKIMNLPFKYELLDDYSDFFNYNKQPNNENIFSLQYIAKSGYGSILNEWYGNRSTATSGQDYTEADFRSVEVYTNRDGSSIDISDMPERVDYNSQKEYGLALMAWYQSTFADADKRLEENILLPGSTLLGKEGKTYKVYWPYSAHVNDSPPPVKTTFQGAALFSWRKFVLTTTDNSDKFQYSSPINTPLIRYADVLLMYAEAKNEAEGPSSKVYNAVNKVRNRAGVVDLPNALSKEKMRRQIRLERFRELMGEGELYFDVKRWQTAATNDHFLGLTNDERDFRGKKMVVQKFPKKNYLWPIPQRAIELNPKLTQNPGW